MKGCLVKHMYPECWKNASCTHLQAQEKTESLASYRPIALLPILGKVLHRTN